MHFLYVLNESNVQQIRGWTPPGCQNAVRLSTSCQQAVKRKKCCLPKHIFSSQQTKILTFTQKFPKIKNRRNFPSGCQVAVKRLSGGCRVAVRQKSSQFEAKIKSGRWFRYHRRAYPTPSVLTPAKFDLRFRLSRGCSPSAIASTTICWQEPLNQKESIIWANLSPCNGSHSNALATNYSVLSTPLGQYWTVLVS